MSIEKKLPDTSDAGWSVTLICGFLLVVHMLMRSNSSKSTDGLDAVALGLIVVGLPPWLARIIDTTKIGGVELKFREIKNEVEQQGDQISTLNFLISHFLSKDELRHLVRLAGQEKFEIDVTVFPAEFQSQLRHLRGLGFIENFEGVGIRSMYRQADTNKRDLREYFWGLPP